MGLLFVKDFCVSSTPFFLFLFLSLPLRLAQFRVRPFSESEISSHHYHYFPCSFVVFFFVGAATSMTCLR